MPRGIVLITLAAVSWGTTGSVMTVLAERAAASPLLVGTARLWIAAALLIVASAARPIPAVGRLGQARAVAGLDIARCVLAGACMAGYQAAYFTAVTLSGIAVTALVAICSAPLMIAVMAPAVLGERLGGRIRLALGLGVIGTALLIAVPGGSLDLSPRFVGGALLALAAGLAYALYVVLTKATLARVAPLPLTALTFTAGAVLLTPAVFWIEAPLRQLALGWPWLLYLGAVATAGAYAVYSMGLRWVPASVAGVATLLEPLTATLLGVLLFGERLGVAGILGALLLFSALGLLIVTKR